MSSSTLIDSERTPLIPKSQSQVVISYPDENQDGESIDDGKGGREVEVYKPGKSSFTQTVCPTPNSIRFHFGSSCDLDCEVQMEVRE